MTTPEYTIFSDFSCLACEVGKIIAQLDHSLAVTAEDLGDELPPYAEVKFNVLTVLRLMNQLKQVQERIAGWEADAFQAEAQLGFDD
jgi:hypothetical protein